MLRAQHSDRFNVGARCLLKQLGTRVENLLKKSLHTYQTISNEDQLPYVSDDSSGSDDDSSYFET